MWHYQHSQQYDSNWFSRRPARARLSNNCRNRLHTFEVLAMLHDDPLLNVVVDGGQPCDHSEAEAAPAPTPTDVVSAPLDAFISTIAIWIFESIIIDCLIQFYGKWWLVRWCCCGADWGKSRKHLVAFSLEAPSVQIRSDWTTPLSCQFFASKIAINLLWNEADRLVRIRLQISRQWQENCSWYFLDGLSEVEIAAGQPKSWGFVPD